MLDDQESDSTDRDIYRNPIIEKALEKGSKSGGDIGDIGGGTGDVVRSSGGGRGGRGSGTRSEVRRTGSASRAAKQAAKAGLEKTFAQQELKREQERRKAQLEERKKRRVKQIQAEQARSKLGSVVRIVETDSERKYIGVRERGRPVEFEKGKQKGLTVVSFPKDRLTFTPEQDKELRGGASRAGKRERLTKASIEREKRKRESFVEEYKAGLKERFVETRTKQLERQAERERQRRAAERLRTAPAYVAPMLQAKQIRQTTPMMAELELPDEFKPEKPTPELSVEVQRGIRQQLQQQKIQQTKAIDVFGKKEKIEAEFGKAFGEKQLLEVGKGIAAFTIEPAKDFYTFYSDLGVASVKTGEELAELVKADTEEQRRNIKANIKSIFKKTFLRKEAVSAVAITALPFIPAKAAKLGFYGLSAFETKQFIEKPSFKGAGSLIALYGISKFPKITRSISRSLKISYTKFKFARWEARQPKPPTFQYMQPALEPQKTEIIMTKEGPIKRFSDFRLEKNRVNLQFAKKPTTTVIRDGKEVQLYTAILVKQARLTPKVPLLEYTGEPIKDVIVRQKTFPKRPESLFFEGLGYDVPTKKVTVLDFPKPKGKQTQIPNFLLEKQPKTKFFKITEGEYAGIDYPIGKERGLIRFKKFKPLGTEKLRFKSDKPKFIQQLTIKSFTGEQVPSKLNLKEVYKSDAVKIDRRMKPFERLIQKKIQTKETIEIKTKEGLALEQKLKPEFAPTAKERVFAGDVRLKGNLGGVAQPKSSQQKQLTKTYFAPEGLLEDIRSGTDIDIFTRKGTRRSLGMDFDLGIDKDLKLNIDTELKKDTRIDERFKQEFKPTEIIGPKIDTGIDTNLDTSQDITPRDIVIPDLNIPGPEIPEPKIPDEPKSPEPEKPTKDILVPRLNFGLDVGGRKARQGYNAFVKRGRKFYKLNKKPLPKNKAFNRMATVLDDTRAVTGKLKETQKKTKQRDVPFRKAEFKFKKKGNTYTERRAYRMDSIQERGLEVVGLKGKKKQTRWF